MILPASAGLFRSSRKRPSIEARSCGPSETAGQPPARLHLPTRREGLLEPRTSEPPGTPSPPDRKRERTPGVVPSRAKGWSPHTGGVISKWSHAAGRRYVEGRTRSRFFDVNAPRERSTYSGLPKVVGRLTAPGVSLAPQWQVRCLRARIQWRLMTIRTYLASVALLQLASCGGARTQPGPTRPTTEARGSASVAAALTLELDGLGCAKIEGLATSACPLDESRHDTAAVVSGLGDQALIAVKRSSSFFSIPPSPMATSAGSFILLRVSSGAIFGVQTLSGRFTCSTSSSTGGFPVVDCSAAG